MTKAHYYCIVTLFKNCILAFVPVIFQRGRVLTALVPLQLMILHRFHEAGSTVDKICSGHVQHAQTEAWPFNLVCLAPWTCSIAMWSLAGCSKQKGCAEICPRFFHRAVHDAPAASSALEEQHCQPTGWNLQLLEHHPNSSGESRGRARDTLELAPQLHICWAKVLLCFHCCSVELWQRQRI